MHFSVELAEIRPVKALVFEIDLERNQLLCIVGKNGSGKTTLAKAILNFSLADTFTRTSSDGIFHHDSKILYRFGNEKFLFSYDDKLRMLNCKVPIPDALKAQVSVELPMPHGHRFNFFRTLSEADHEIRRATILGDYRKPEEIIEFLSHIYGERRFDDLIEVRLRTGSCCCIHLPDGRYLREDYFSSGEYFLINLYRRVRQGQRLVVIDEIDISLDAAAQARLAEKLRDLCIECHVNIVFTSHSLAMMQTLQSNELFYMERSTAGATLAPASFSYVKSLMFGFASRDKVILTEDPVLKDFLSFVIHRYCPPSFYSYYLIEVGGAGQVVDLMTRNEREGFLGAANDVIAVLDGDQKQAKHAQGPRTHCIPLDSVEKALWNEHQRPDFQPAIAVKQANAKALFKYVIRNKILSQEEIFDLLCVRHHEAMQEFAKSLRVFLCRPS
jgi:ABC-type dipeptide/oligopeptide/nickel transport system ATPase subunit